MNLSSASPSSTSGFVTGGVRRVLRVEAIAVFALAVGLYVHSGAPLVEFLVLFLVPDLSFVGYLFGTKVGAAAYNAMHSYVGPVALGALAGLGVLPAAALPIAFIWAAHVGFDRALGYGLKYANAFGETHLGLIGRGAKVAATKANA